MRIYQEPRRLFFGLEVNQEVRSAGKNSGFAVEMLEENNGFLNRLGLNILAANHNFFYHPPELKKGWEDTLNKIFNDPDWSAQMNKAGYPPSGLAGENLAAGVTATLSATGKFKEIISSLGIK